MKLRAEVYTVEQLDSVLKNENIDMVYAPYSIIKNNHYSFSERIIIIPPIFLSDCEQKVIEKLRFLRENSFDKVMVHTIGHIELMSDEQFKLYGGYRLNCINSDSIEFFLENGLTDIIVSPEMPAVKMSDVKTDFGFIAYGHLPLMITRRCPISNAGVCNTTRCDRKIIDRKGNSLDIICSENTAEILNGDVLYLADKLDNFKNADFAVLKFTTETNVNDIISSYANKEAAKISKFTRGLYFRGIEV